ncbi:MAG: DUF3300 domain-containing protein [Pseudomonadota bacterium]
MLARMSLTLVVASVLTAPATAQVPVDENGEPIGSVYSSEGNGNADFATQDDSLLSVSELSDLVAPVALYPDDLLAIVLPASTFPLQIVEAARFLEAVETDASLTPEDDWDDSVVALLNYPEVVELMNSDLDWTWALGEAVVAQQADILTAVNDFRNRARAAGNLATDQYQRIEEGDDGIIEIDPVEDDVIYVPYYEPERVVVYQTRPVYHYYARSYPVYYYPYPDYHVHYRPFFGVTTAFSIGWVSSSLHVWHHSFYGHPYYGHFYRDRWWYRRPTISVFHSRYYGGRGVTRRHYRYGDYWQPRFDRRLSRSNQRITRSYGARDVRRSEPARRGFSQDRRRSDVRANRDTSVRTPVRQRSTVTDNRSRGRFASSERRDSAARSNSSSETRSRQSFSASQRRSESVRVQPQRSPSRSTTQPTRQGFSSSPRRSEAPRSVPRATPQRQPTSAQRSVRREPTSRQSFSSRPSQRQMATPRSPQRSSSRSPSQRSSSFSRPSRSESRRSAPSRSSASRRDSSRRR